MTAPAAVAVPAPAAVPPARRPRALAVAASALVAASAVGGAVSVALGENTWSDAWTAEATLAAPWPMLLVQAASAAAAVRGGRRTALAGSVVLGLAAALTGVSGFFDGQLGKEGLGPGYVAMQLVFVVLAAAVVVLSGRRVRALRRG